jgi:hypothetical protein
VVDSSNSAISFISSFRTRRTAQCADSVEDRTTESGVDASRRTVSDRVDASRRTVSDRVDASRRTKSFFSSSDKIALKSIIRGLAPLCVDFILFYA